MTHSDLERRIRAGETLAPDEVLDVWDDVKCGLRKQFPHGTRPNNYSFLRDRQHRRWILQKFISNCLRDKGRHPEQNDYKDARLNGLLGHYLNSSSYDAAVFAGFTNPENVVYYDVVLDKMPWLAIRLPQKFWLVRETRTKGTKWAVRVLRKLGKTPEEIEWRDIEQLIGHVRVTQKTRLTLPELLDEAGYKISPAKMQKAPNSYWREPENRRAYILHRKEELGRPPRSREVPSSLLRAAGSYECLLAEAGLLTSEAKSE
ncbi:MAG: hypothetical protein HYT16_02575 [DPANN group archaeon]|nr:hypothetical protein [DPANN group archaeon]